MLQGRKGSRDVDAVSSDVRAMSPTERRFVVWAPIGVALAIAGLYVVSRKAYLFVLMDYSVVEDLQFLLYAAAMVLSAVLARRLWRTGDQRLLGALYGVATVGLFFVAGEEVSWGAEVWERIIPWWPEEEELRQVNAQGEITIHNLHGLGRVFTWFLFVLALYGVVSPLLRAALGRRATRPWVDYVSFPAATVPALLIAVAFFVALLFFTGSHNDVQRGSPEQAFLRYQEVAELNIAFSILVFVRLLLRTTAGPSRRVTRRRRTPFPGPRPSR